MLFFNIKIILASIVYAKCTAVDTGANGPASDRIPLQNTTVNSQDSAQEEQGEMKTSAAVKTEDSSQEKQKTTKTADLAEETRTSMLEPNNIITKSFDCFVQSIQKVCENNDKFIESLDNKDSYKQYVLEVFTADSYDLLGAIKEAVSGIDNSTNLYPLAVHFWASARILVVLEHLFKKTQLVFQNNIESTDQLARQDENADRLKRRNLVFNALKNINKLMQQQVKAIMNGASKIALLNKNLLNTRLAHCKNYEKSIKLLKEGHIYGKFNNIELSIKEEAVEKVCDDIVCSLTELHFLETNKNALLVSGNSEKQIPSTSKSLEEDVEPVSEQDQQELKFLIEKNIVNGSMDTKINSELNKKPEDNGRVQQPETEERSVNNQIKTTPNNSNEYKNRIDAALASIENLKKEVAEIKDNVIKNERDRINNLIEKIEKKLKSSPDNVALKKMLETMNHNEEKLLECTKLNTEMSDAITSIVNILKVIDTKQTDINPPELENVESEENKLKSHQASLVEQRSILHDISASVSTVLNELEPTLENKNPGKINDDSPSIIDIINQNKGKMVLGAIVNLVIVFGFVFIPKILRKQNETHSFSDIINQNKGAMVLCSMAVIALVFCFAFILKMIRKSSSS
ncbi:hypothetical protein ENBRE01_2764 [Enteropsectra breve]|nr:hypothetical protein ENBRE01_2764 [Enteropsectra breve]